MINQRRIIYFLVSLVVLLLLINVFLRSLEKKKNSDYKNNLKAKIIEDKFSNTLKSFGILDEWIIKRNLRSKIYDSVKYSYSVSLPFGVTIPELIKELNINFAELPVYISAKEKKINDRTDLTITSGNYIKLVSEFKYDSKLKRSASEISFLLTEIENATESDFKLLFYHAYPFAAILPLEERSQNLAEYLKLNDYNYIIKLSDDSDQTDFELNQDLGLDILTRNVSHIISSFNSPTVFFLDELNSKFSPEIKIFLKEQFAKKNRKLIPLENYTQLKGENIEDLRSLFEFHINKMNPGEKRIFRIRYEDWILLWDDLNVFIKKGNRIVKPEELL